MHRFAIVIPIVAAALVVVSPAVYAQECLSSTAVSEVFSIQDTGICGSSASASGDFRVATMPPNGDPCNETTETAALPIQIDTVWSPGSIRRHPQGQQVTLPDLPLSAVFGDRFYIEAADRSSGIGVIDHLGGTPGWHLTVTGTLATVDGEVVLTDPAVEVGALGVPPVPLTMRPYAAFHGADPTGLLVRTFGSATQVQDAWFLLSDGGKETLTALPESLPAPIPGEFVILQGVPGMANIDGQITRVIRLTAQEYPQ